MKIERFEDIQVWQKSRQLVKGVYLATSGTQAFKQDFSLKDQIRRAAISVMSNIAEGYAPPDRHLTNPPEVDKIPIRY